MDADLLSDVVAVLDGDGVNKGGDLLVAFLLLDHIDNVLKIVLLGDLLGLGTAWHSPTGFTLFQCVKVFCPKIWHTNFNVNFFDKFQVCRVHLAF